MSDYPKKRDWWCVKLVGVLLTIGFGLWGVFSYVPTPHLYGHGYRIQFDGVHFFVQRRDWSGSWDDDIIGGYFPTFDAASNRVNWLRLWDQQYNQDRDSKRKSKTVGKFP